jgi:hypothetical protein
MRAIWFYDVLEVQQPAFLSSVLACRFGYSDPNPGPVVAFPPNSVLFPVGIPECLAPGMQLAIPWERKRLLKKINIDKEYVASRKGCAERALKAIKAATDDVNRVGITVDVVACVATILVGQVSMARQVNAVLNPRNLSTAVDKVADFERLKKLVYLTEATVKDAKAAQAAIAEAPHVAGKIAAEMGWEAHLKVNGVGVMVGLDPGRFVDHKSWWQNVIRHSLSLMSPSYWAGLAASAIEGDWDLWKYGPDGVQDRQAARILQSLAKDVNESMIRIAAMAFQSLMPFYDYRVQQGMPVYPAPLDRSST